MCVKWLAARPGCSLTRSRGCTQEEYPHTAYPFAREGASLIVITPPAPSSVPVQPNNAWLPPPPEAPEKARSSVPSLAARARI
jgi:hypothetical protein